MKDYDEMNRNIMMVQRYVTTYDIVINRDGKTWLNGGLIWKLSPDPTVLILPAVVIE